MNAQLVQRLSAITDEEQRVLAGQPILREDYASDSRFVISGEKLLRPRQQITLRPHTRFTAFPMHSHDYVEILYMLSGQTIHEFPGQEPLSLQAGELLMINCQSRHGIRQCGQEDVGVNFIVQPSFFDDAIDTLGPSNLLGRFLIDALKRGESTVPFLHFRVSENQAVQSLLESILFSMISKPPSGGRALKVSMTLLFLYLMNDTDHLNVPMSSGNALVLSVLDEIRQHYIDICLKDIAKAHQVSPAYLSQTVRSVTGKSCTELIQQQRIARAQHLLRETDLSVNEVCAAVGYANTGHFYRLFFALTGMSPKAYRDVNSGR